MRLARSVAPGPLLALALGVGPLACGGGKTGNPGDAGSGDTSSQERDTGTDSTDTGQENGSGDPCADWPDPGVTDVNCGPAPLEVHFFGEGLAEAFGTGCTWRELEWSFGDGSTSDEADTVHTYVAPGDYEVDLAGTVDCPSWKAEADLQAIDVVRAW